MVRARNHGPIRALLPDEWLPVKGDDDWDEDDADQEPPGPVEEVVRLDCLTLISYKRHTTAQGIWFTITPDHAAGGRGRFRFSSDAYDQLGRPRRVRTYLGASALVVVPTKEDDPYGVPVHPERRLLFSKSLYEALLTGGWPPRARLWGAIKRTEDGKPCLHLKKPKEPGKEVSR